ncbi:hypothetical protein IFM89_030991 [Coptis chinensis]|uniref:Fe2OG dioxygenase domain-containing protein n=1 Tax=Coptis chinensis TaxID=261450 RepID=A0A835H7T1_9MAGN|nr:hypothetical protein IFM89_030991 [Coptis chinensis]
MDYDRMKEVKEFDDSKIGVKGLVDSGITTIPRFFVHKPENLADIKTCSESTDLPIVDLFGVNSHRRPEIIENLSEAAREWGFFQVINHGIPLPILNATISAIRSFHEQPPEIKKLHYVREQPVSYVTNIDLFRSEAASWRDTLLVLLAPHQPQVVEEIPAICRKEVVDWGVHVRRLAEMLMELLGEGLGLVANTLKERKCSSSMQLAGHYYPYCAESESTLGFPSHTDKGVLTVLLQDHGGLQMKKGEQWVVVKPIPGALVINVGDLLQMLSNDQYKSGEHRVLANSFREPRTSIAVFVGVEVKDTNTASYGPLQELLSPAKPPLYRNFTMSELVQKFYSRALGNMSILDEFKL